MLGRPFVDAHQAARITPGTLENYRLALRPFLEWLGQASTMPQGADQWDEALVRFKNEFAGDSPGTLTRSKFVRLVAAVEFVLPRFRGHLPWSHAVCTGWAHANPIKHTVPLGKALSKLMAIFLASSGCPRLGLALVLQSHTGLRPSELLGLVGSDVSFPEDSGRSLKQYPCVLALGTRRSTKVRRVQTVLLDDSLSDIVMLLRCVVRAGRAADRLLPVSLSFFRSALRRVEAQLGVQCGFGAHSPRAGFASDSRAEGWSFERIREAGRWTSDQSLRIYLDVVSARSVLVQVRSAGWSEALAWADRGWILYHRPLLQGAGPSDGAFELQVPGRPLAEAVSGAAQVAAAQWEPEDDKDEQSIDSDADDARYLHDERVSPRDGAGQGTSGVRSLAAVGGARSRGWFASLRSAAGF